MIYYMWSTRKLISYSELWRVVCQWQLILESIWGNTPGTWLFQTARRNYLVLNACKADGKCAENICSSDKPYCITEKQEMQLRKSKPCQKQFHTSASPWGQTGNKAKEMSGLHLCGNCKTLVGSRSLHPGGVDSQDLGCVGCLGWVGFVEITAPVLCGNHRNSVVWKSQDQCCVEITGPMSCGNHRTCVVWKSQDQCCVEITGSVLCGNHRTKVVWKSQDQCCVGNHRTCVVWKSQDQWVLCGNHRTIVVWKSQDHCCVEITEPLLCGKHRTPVELKLQVKIIGSYLCGDCRSLVA